MPEIDYKLWEIGQIHHELEFWKDPVANDTLEDYPDYKTRLIDITLNMFSALKLSFENGIVCDVGAGPHGGILSLVNARLKIAVDPLNCFYLDCDHSFNGIHPITACSESLPFPSGSVSACFCTNALDHMYKPGEALIEMERILKPGGYLALAVDIGGAPKHPLAIQKEWMDLFLTEQRFEIVEKRCSDTIKTTWSALLKIPLYVFQGYKRDRSRQD